MKKEKKNEILHVICIFHWQMIWLPGKFDNFKWQWQLATPTPTSIHPTYPFPLLKEGTTTNSASSTSAAAAIYAFKWRMMMFTIIMRMMMMMHLYLVCILCMDAFCRCADCQVCRRPVLIKKTARRTSSTKCIFHLFPRTEALYQFCSEFKRFRKRHVYTKNIY